MDRLSDHRFMANYTEVIRVFRATSRGPPADRPLPGGAKGARSVTRRARPIPRCNPASGGCPRAHGVNSPTPAPPERWPGDGSMTSGVPKMPRTRGQAGDTLSGCLLGYGNDPARQQRRRIRTPSGTRGCPSQALARSVLPMTVVTRSLPATRRGGRAPPSSCGPRPTTGCAGWPPRGRPRGSPARRCKRRPGSPRPGPGLEKNFAGRGRRNCPSYRPLRTGAGLVAFFLVPFPGGLRGPC
jgi:hypothetical protein